MATATEAPATAEGLTSHTQNQLAALAQMREPFSSETVHKLPKVTCRDCREARYKVCDKHTRARCDGCAGNLTTAHIHLDYVGHAELTIRLLEVDPLWQWEPMAFDPDGLPKFDQHGGLWIKLTVAGITRPGYGDAQEKRGPNAVKEAIGDALRNAAMRFGAALTLWSKTDRAKADAAAEELSREPSREQRLAELYGLMQQRWGNKGGLRNVKALVDNEQFHESQVADENKAMRLFGELLTERIEALENPAPKPPAPAPATTTTPADSPPDPETAAPTLDPVQNAVLGKLMGQISTEAAWKSLDVLTQVRGEAEVKQLLGCRVQGPPPALKWMPFGTLLDDRIAELKAERDNRQSARAA